MTTQVLEPIKMEHLDEYTVQAAKAADYEKGFGIEGCDLTKPIWWAAYCRQSLDQQTQNNRLPEYLLTMAKMAKEQGIIVPREYVLYDHETGEHLDRPSMQFLRHELVGKQKVVGILFADLRCLSREPAPQQVFERECEILSVRLLFGDAPSGMDVGSQFARSALTFSNKLARLATNRNARAGNVGRVLKGSAPAHKAAYGFTYRRDAEIRHDGSIWIKRAWWELNATDAEGNLVQRSPADIVVKIFKWIGSEKRSLYWVARELNEMGIKSPGGREWLADSIRYILLNHAYKGIHRYNAVMRVPNPSRPLGDITGEVKRTLRRPKPPGEAVECKVPALVGEELWLKANNVIQGHGRGKWKEGKAIPAVLRNRIFCPRCGKPMTVRRSSHGNKFYYVCSKHLMVSETKRCSYRRFIPSVWDESVWDCVYALMQQEDWVQKQLTTLENQKHDADKLVKLEQSKILQAQNKIDKVKDGFEGGLYNLDEAKYKIYDYRQVIVKAQKEIERLTGLTNNQQSMNVEKLKKELGQLATENLDKATLNEKKDVLSRLGIRVYPTEDLKAVKIRCALDLHEGGDSPSSGCRIVGIDPTIQLSKTLNSKHEILNKSE